MQISHHTTCTRGSGHQGPNFEITGIRYKEDPQIAGERSRGLIHAINVSARMGPLPPPISSRLGGDVTRVNKELFCAEGMEKYSQPS